MTGGTAGECENGREGEVGGVCPLGVMFGGRPSLSSRQLTGRLTKRDTETDAKVIPVNGRIIGITGR